MIFGYTMFGLVVAVALVALTLGIFYVVIQRKDIGDDAVWGCIIVFVTCVLFAGFVGELMFGTGFGEYETGCPNE
jgi:steroid 5-alpha reductase family enzyme